MLVAAALAGALAAHAPVVVHDRHERYPLASAAGHSQPAVYGRSVTARDGGMWLQYWLYFPYQDQDRGVLRSGRHEGDWELVQYRVDGQLVEAVYAQHSGAERCGAREIRRRAGRPVVFAAHGSHASYLRPGTRDRLWPDPNDEADGRGTVVAPPVLEITASSPVWMRRAEPWGDSRARWFVPPEQDSPRGPAFQPSRWDPEAFAASARPCQARCDEVGECDAPEKALTATAIVLPLALFAALWRRNRPPRSGGALPEPRDRQLW
jgi:hypothetical protein